MLKFKDNNKTILLLPFVMLKKITLDDILFLYFLLYEHYAELSCLVL